MLSRFQILSTNISALWTTHRNLQLENFVRNSLFMGVPTQKFCILSVPSQWAAANDPVIMAGHHVCSRLQRFWRRSYSAWLQFPFEGAPREAGPSVGFCKRSWPHEHTKQRCTRHACSFLTEVQTGLSITLLRHCARWASSTNSQSERCIDGRRRGITKTVPPRDNTADGFIFHGRNSRNPKQR